MRVCVALCLVGFLALSASAAAQEPDGYVTGTLIDGVTGQPIPDLCCVFAYDASGYDGSASTDAAGVYRIGPIPAGGYSLRFEDLSHGRGTGYGAEWFDGKPDYTSADLVSVAPGETVSGIDFRLAPPPPVVGGFIAGTLIEDCYPPPPAPLAEGHPFGIRVITLDGVLQSEWFLTAGPDGSYRLGPVPAGTYRLDFDDRVGAPQAIALYGTVEGVEVAVDQTATADFLLRCAAGQAAGTTLPYTGLPAAAITAALAAVGLGTLLLRRSRRGW